MAEWRPTEEQWLKLEAECDAAGGLRPYVRLHDIANGHFYVMSERDLLPPRYNLYGGAPDA